MKIARALAKMKYFGLELAATFIFTLALTGCNMTEEKKVPSEDMTALNKIVQLEVAVKSGKYEIFSTPETTGGVPGPTDYVILVGEFDIATDEKFSTLPVPSMWLVPNIVRPWLSEPFRTLAQKYRSKKIPEDFPGCYQTAATLRNDDQKLQGIKCVKNGKMFVYMPLFNADM